MKKCFFGTVVIFLLSGCVVSDSMWGRLPPDLSALHIGASKQDISSAIIRHKRIVQARNGDKVYIYEYEKGRGPSLPDSAGNTLMEILTLMMWEYSGTEDKHKETFTVVYDKNNKAVAINKYLF